MEVGFLFGWFFLLWIVVDAAGADELMCLEFKQGEGGMLFFLNKE